jgi:5-methyltetrahydropteroyltriglutamate--homocysteine methyltransferase
MRRSTEQILTTHAGSLPRPAALVEAYARRADGQAVDDEALARIVSVATDKVVQRQLEAGIDVGNDGEQCREGFFLYLQHRLSGFGGSWERKVPQDVARYPQYQQQRAALQAGRPSVSNFSPPEAIAEVRHVDPDAMGRECAAFAATMARQDTSFIEPFITAPSPGIVAAAMRNRWYDSEENYLNALADCLRIEYTAVIDAGFVLQIDAPDLALEKHIGFQDQPVASFVNFVDLVIEAINRALQGIPADRVRLHVCWGNYEGPHDCDVALSEILPSILRTHVGAFMLPFANPRHAHEMNCFDETTLGDDRILIAGVVDVTSNFVEHPQVIAERIERAARAIGDPTRVMAGTDCGFDTSAGMGRVAGDVAWAKLASMVGGAKLASGRLL